MTNINGRQQQSYWCHLCSERISFISSSSSPHLLLCPHCHGHFLEEIGSSTINTNLFFNSKDLHNENPVFNPEEEEEDNNRKQYTCYQCDVIVSLISSSSSSSSPLLLCPHCHGEFWEELDSSSSTSNNPNFNSNLHIDVPEEEQEQEQEQEQDRYGNSSTVAETEKKNTKKKGWRELIFHKIRGIFGFAI